MNNASSKDTVTVEVEAWLQRPEASARSTRGAGSIRLFVNYRMRRMSDGRLMMVSSAEKLVAGHVFDDLPFAAEFLGGPRLATFR